MNMPKPIRSYGEEISHILKEHGLIAEHEAGNFTNFIFQH